MANLLLTGRDIHEIYCEVAEKRWKEHPHTRRLFLTPWDEMTAESRALYDDMASRINEQLDQTSVSESEVAHG